MHAAGNAWDLKTPRNGTLLLIIGFLACKACPREAGLFGSAACISDTDFRKNSVVSLHCCFIQNQQYNLDLLAPTGISSGLSTPKAGNHQQSAN